MTKPDKTCQEYNEQLLISHERADIMSSVIRDDIKKEYKANQINKEADGSYEDWK